MKSANGPSLSRALFLLFARPQLFAEAARALAGRRDAEERAARLRSEKANPAESESLQYLHRTMGVRQSWIASVTLVAASVAAGWLLGTILRNWVGPAPTWLPALLQYLGVGVLLVATLAKSGWAIQTLGGSSLLERCDNFLYRSFYVAGTMALVLSVSWPAP